MDLSKLKNVDSSEVPYFVVDDDGLIVDDQQKEEYYAYRNKYKEYRGVMPEFDIINNPVMAVPVSDVIWPVDIKKKVKKGIAGSIAKSAWGVAKGMGKMTIGFAGAFAGFGAGKLFEGIGETGASLLGGALDRSNLDPRLAAELAERFQKIVDRYRYVYGLAFAGYGLGIKANGPVENIKDGLGYTYDAQKGIYREGTWQNGNLVFGLTVIGDSAFYGDYREGLPSEGVVVQEGMQIMCGVFSDDLELECQEGFAINFENKMMWVGPFSGGQMNGMCIAYHMGEGMLFKTVYENGKTKKGLSGWLADQKGKHDTSKKANERRVEAAKRLIDRFKK